MRFLADENCGGTLMSTLAAAGHDVKSIVRTQPGMEDGRVFALAESERRVLLTHDRGFGLLAERAQEKPPAIVLMRLRGLSAATRARIVLQAVSDLGKSINGHFVVIEHAGVRTRRYKDLEEQ